MISLISYCPQIIINQPSQEVSGQDHNVSQHPCFFLYFFPSPHFFPSSHLSFLLLFFLSSFFLLFFLLSSPHPFCPRYCCLPLLPHSSEQCCVSNTLISGQNLRPPPLSLFACFPESVVAGFLTRVFFLVPLHSVSIWSLNNQQMFAKQFLFPWLLNSYHLCTQCFPLTQYHTCVQTDWTLTLAHTFLTLVLCMCFQIDLILLAHYYLIFIVIQIFYSQLSSFPFFSSFKKAISDVYQTLRSRLIQS